MPLRVGLRSSVLREVRLFPLEAGRPRPPPPARAPGGPLDRPRTLSERPRPPRSSGRPRPPVPRASGRPPERPRSGFPDPVRPVSGRPVAARGSERPRPELDRGLGPPLALAPRDWGRPLPAPRMSGRPVERPPSDRPVPRAGGRPEPDRPDLGRSSSRRGLRGGSSTAVPVVEGGSGYRCEPGRNAMTPASMGGRHLRKNRRRPTLPGGLPPSTIGAGGLNCRVRNGNGCVPAAMATGSSVSLGWCLRVLHSEHERWLLHVVCAIKPSAD
jgi:hypothetical protein